MGNSSPMITGNTIKGNLAVSGGGILVDDSSPTIKSNTIRGNTAEAFGGGIRVLGNSSPRVTGNTFENNEAFEGGAISISSDSTLKLNDPDDNTYIGNIPDDIH